MSLPRSHAAERAFLAELLETFPGTTVYDITPDLARPRVVSVGSGSSWDHRRNTSEVRLSPNAPAEARAALEKYHAEQIAPDDEQLELG